MHEQAMQTAIGIARKGLEAGNSPFGAAVFRNGELIAATHNTVWQDLDPTAHAEINAIRSASRTLGTIDLSGCLMYATTEPCPMCLTAIHWAKLDRVIYGATISDALKAGFSELTIPAQDMVRMGKSRLIVESGCCEKECAGLFNEFLQLKKAAPY